MNPLGPLARPPLAKLWIGQLLSATGHEFYAVAVVWTASGLVGQDAGYVSALQAGALLAGSLCGGIVTDGWRPRSTMIAADLARAALALALAAAGALGALGLPLLVAAAGGVALCAAAFDPALQASLPALAPGPELRYAANALFDATRRAARILGPGLVAAVNGLMPTGQFFAVTGAGFLLSAAAVAAAFGPATGAAATRTTAAGEGTRVRVVDSLTGGLAVVRRSPVLLYGVLANLVGNVGWGLGVLLGMLLLLRRTSADPLTDYGLMMGAYGVGNLASNLLLGALGPGRPAPRLVLSKLVFGLGVVLLPFAPDRLALMGIAGFAALNGPLENLAMLQLIQGPAIGGETSPLRVAQVYRVQMCAVFSGLLLAYLAAPSLYGAFGLAPVVAGSGAACLGVGCIGLWLDRRGLFGPAGRPTAAPSLRS